MLFSKLLNYVRSPKRGEGASINCEINFDSAIFYPPESITGNIILSIHDKPCVIEGIVLEVSGEAQCGWKFHKYVLPVIATNKKFSGRDVFLFERQNLAEKQNRINLSRIPQRFLLKVSLEENLPASWTGQHFIVDEKISFIPIFNRYIMNVLIKEPTKRIKSFTKEIVIGASRNLSLEKHLLCEARTDVCRQFYYSFINLGIVEISVWMPVCGISAGQSIPVLCTIGNNSSILFGGLTFVLTQIEMYRSQKPTHTVKIHRTDVCSVSHMVDIFNGKYQFYCILKTNKDLLPTNQYYKCTCCQITYELWVSLQGATPRYKAYGYPNINTPPIPLIVGTEPICLWNYNKISKSVINPVLEIHQLVTETLLHEQSGNQ